MLLLNILSSWLYAIALFIAGAYCPTRPLIVIAALAWLVVRYGNLWIEAAYLLLLVAAVFYFRYQRARARQ